MSTLAIVIVLVITALLSVAVTGLIFYKVVVSYFDNQQKSQMLQMKIDEHKESLKVVTPIRLQAYERMALYLERISPNRSWNRIREAKEEMINLINGSAVKLPVDADPTSLAGAIFESCAKSKIPTDEALEFMKNEIQERFA